MASVSTAELPIERPLAESLKIYAKRLGIFLAVVLGNGLLLTLLWIVTFPVARDVLALTWIGIFLGLYIYKMIAVLRDQHDVFESYVEKMRPALMEKMRLALMRSGQEIRDTRARYFFRVLRRSRRQRNEDKDNAYAISVVADTLIRETLSEEHGLERVMWALGLTLSDNDARRRVADAIERALDQVMKNPKNESEALQIMRTVDVLRELRKTLTDRRQLEP